MSSLHASVVLGIVLCYPLLLSLSFEGVWPSPREAQVLARCKWHCRASTLQSFALLQAALSPSSLAFAAGSSKLWGWGLFSPPLQPPSEEHIQPSVVSHSRDFLWFPLPFSPDCSEPNWNFLCCSGWVSTSLTFPYWMCIPVLLIVLISAVSGWSALMGCQAVRRGMSLGICTALAPEHGAPESCVCQ